MISLKGFKEGALIFLEWVQYVALLPLNAGFQGKWHNRDDSPYTNWGDIYAPMYDNYAMGQRFSYHYGGYQLLHKVVLICVIGSSIKGVDPLTHDTILEGDPTSTPDDSGPYVTLWILALVNFLHLMFLLMQMPYNERLENITQASQKTRTPLHRSPIAVHLARCDCTRPVDVRVWRHM